MKLPAICTKARAAVVVAAANLEHLLDELSGYGHPSLWRMDDGSWCCRIQMATPGAAGVRFEIRSDYHSPTARTAAAECLERVHAALGGAHGAAS